MCGAPILLQTLPRTHVNEDPNRGTLSNNSKCEWWGFFLRWFFDLLFLVLKFFCGLEMTKMFLLGGHFILNSINSSYVILLEKHSKLLRNLYSYLIDLWRECWHHWVNNENVKALSYHYLSDTIPSIQYLLSFDFGAVPMLLGSGIVTV